MKFSIIIPVYKTENYVRQCVDSVLCQSFTDFELLLVDNESPDRCPEICEDYAKKDARVRVIHKTHGTAASARNVGMKEAKGEYLCFLDSDDFWLDGEVLSKINGKLEQTGADIVNLYYKFYFEASGEYLLPQTVNFSGFDELSNDEKVTFLISHDRLNPSAWGMCISRTFLEECQGYFDESRVIEDIDWCLRLFSRNPTVDVVKEPVYGYRKGREGSVTRMMKAKSLYDLCEIIENSPNVLGLADENYNVMMNYVTYQILITLALTYRKRVEATKKQRKEIRKRLKVFSEKYLRKYQQHPKVQKAVKVYNVFGFGITAWVLGFYLNHRGR